MRKRILFATIAILGAAGVGFWFFRPSDTLTVTTVLVERGTIETVIRATGRVINDRTVILTALLDGQVRSIRVQKGDKVQVGQVLASLDSREADAVLSQTEARLASERNLVEQLSRKLTRLNKTSASGAVSVQTIDELATQLSGAQDQQRIAEAALHVARIQREKADITAPFAGVITEKLTEVGQWVEAGTKLLTLVANEGREIEANLDAADSGLVAKGQTVKMSCDAFPGKQWTETVRWIAPALTQGDKESINTFAARMSLGPAAPPLLLGQQLDVNIMTVRHAAVLKLPYGALIDAGDQRKVALIEQGRVHLVTVSVGIEDLSHIEIIKGVAEGTHVILPEGKTLHEGQAVTPLPSPPH